LEQKNFVFFKETSHTGHFDQKFCHSTIPLLFQKKKVLAYCEKKKSGDPEKLSKIRGQEFAKFLISQEQFI
jgi:hypothetical protein